MSIRFNRRATGKWLICPWCFILPRPPQGQFLSPETIARAFQATAPIPPGARPLPATAAPGKGPSLRASLHGVSPREARSSLSSRRGSLCRRGASAAPPSRWLRLQDGDSTISLRDFPAGRWVPDGHVFSHFSRVSTNFGQLGSVLCNSDRYCKVNRTICLILLRFVLVCVGWIPIHPTGLLGFV
jgi:hypothetical protein